jgi:ubiquinone/menaquinone biosynthesis C-methylase UbiE
VIDDIGLPATDLGVRTHVDAVFDVLGPVEGLEIADVGCGEGENPRREAARGAQVTGFDPFIEGADWTASGSGRYRLVRATADALPLGDGSCDIVLFIFSLHHVPKAKLPAALAEARRVLRPAGRLLIAEPLARGASHYVSSPFHDETAVRADAAAAIAADAIPSFASHRTYAYTDRRVWKSFDQYAARMIANMRFNGYTEAAVLAPEVRRRFAETFAAHGGDFDQPVRIDLLSRPR